MPRTLRSADAARPGASAARSGRPRSTSTTSRSGSCRRTCCGASRCSSLAVRRLADRRRRSPARRRRSCVAFAVRRPVRLAALTARGRDVVLSDASTPIRGRRLAVLVAGVASRSPSRSSRRTSSSGLISAAPVGWALATLAAWGLVGMLGLGFAFWVLAGRPGPRGPSGPRPGAARRAARRCAPGPARRRSRSCWPLLLLVSTVAFAALADDRASRYAALVAGRYVLPLADRLEALARAREAAGDGRGRPTRESVPPARRTARSE